MITRSAAPGSHRTLVSFIQGPKSFEAAGVLPHVDKTLRGRFGATAPSEGQSSLIPTIISHKHVIVKDVTGSGKTLGVLAAVLSKPIPSVFQIRSTSQPWSSTHLLEPPTIPPQVAERIHAIQKHPQTTREPEPELKPAAPAIEGTVSFELDDAPVKGSTMSLSDSLALAQSKIGSKEPPVTLSPAQLESILENAGSLDPRTRLLLEKHRFTSVLMIVPTRELASQICEWLRRFIADFQSNQAASADGAYEPEPEPEAAIFQCVVSGVDAADQEALLRRVTPRILIGTPARLLELHTKGAFSSARLQTLVVDEVDRIVEVPKRFAPLRERFKRLRHPLAGESLIGRIVEERSAIFKSMRERETRISPIAASAARRATASNLVALEGMTALRFDPSQATPLQIIACSATSNNNLRFHLTRLTRWMEGAAIVDMVHESQAPAGIIHKAFVVDKLGNAHQMALEAKPVAQPDEASDAATDADASAEAQQSNEPELLPKSALEELKRHGYINKDEIYSEADFYETSEEENAAIMFHQLPYDHDYMVETVAAMIHKDDIKRAFVFTKASVSITRLIERLRELGVKADKLFNLVDYAGTTIRPHMDLLSGGGVSGSAQDGAESAIAQPARPAIPFERFINGEVNVICATEHEARGLDLPEVTHVFILGDPADATSYLHMAGRVGRFSNSGTVITILGGFKFWRKQVSMLRSMNIALDPN
nr:hypothetical protein HK105_004027 [Polyrhizophydium stewartii]